MNCPLMVYFCWLVSARREYICFPCTAILAKSLHFSNVAFVAGKALGVSNRVLTTASTNFCQTMDVFFVGTKFARETRSMNLGRIRESEKIFCWRYQDDAK